MFHPSKVWHILLSKIMFSIKIPPLRGSNSIKMRFLFRYHRYAVFGLILYSEKNSKGHEGTIPQQEQLFGLFFLC